MAAAAGVIRREETGLGVARFAPAPHPGRGLRQPVAAHSLRRPFGVRPFGVAGVVSAGAGVRGGSPLTERTLGRRALAVPPAIPYIWGEPFPPDP